MAKFTPLPGVVLSFRAPDFVFRRARSVLAGRSPHLRLLRRHFPA